MFLQVTKNTVTVFESETNICDTKKRADMVTLPLSGFAVPEQCPVPATFTNCRNNEMVFKFSESTRKLLPVFSMASSKSVIKIVLTHDTGKSCFEVETEIDKVSRKLNKRN